MSPIGADEWAKGMLNDMVNEGWLEVVRVDETGEQFVKPSNHPPIKELTSNQ